MNIYIQLFSIPATPPPVPLPLIAPLLAGQLSLILPEPPVASPDPDRLKSCLGSPALVPPEVRGLEGTKPTPPDVPADPDR
jgi:hypothetical protein